MDFSYTIIHVFKIARLGHIIALDLILVIIHAYHVIKFVANVQVLYQQIVQVALILIIISLEIVFKIVQLEDFLKDLDKFKSVEQIVLYVLIIVQLVAL